MFILRHGETVWNVAGRMQGRLDSPLTERGRAQALRQGEILRRAGAADLPVFASPLGRALQTARLALPGCQVVEDPRLAEIALGDWQGLTAAQLAADVPLAPDYPDSILWKFDAPGGERFAQMLARLRGFLDDVAGPAVIVTHGVASQLLRGSLLGLDIAAMDALPDRQGVVFRVESGREEILAG